MKLFRQKVLKIQPCGELLKPKQRKPGLWGNDRLWALSLQGWEYSHCRDRDIVSKKRQPCKQAKPLFLITTFNHGNITSKSLQRNTKLRDSYSNPVFPTCDCIHNVTGNFTSNSKTDASSVQPSAAQCLILTLWKAKPAARISCCYFLPCFSVLTSGVFYGLRHSMYPLFLSFFF